MDYFGLSLDSPLLPNVDTYINPAKDEDVHRSALNAVVVNIHRAGPGAFENLVTEHMGEYLANPDAKVRERSTLLLAELLVRLPTLPLTGASASRFAAFFSSRLGDYPSVVPALKALSGLLKNHESALVDAHAPAPAAAAVVDGGRGMDQSEGGGEGQGGDRREAREGRKRERKGGGGGSAGVIARAVFEELHLPALAQSIRQAALTVLRALVTSKGFAEALSSGMGKAFISGLVQSLEGEKDPRCLIVGLGALRQAQLAFEPTALEETCEAVFDATACYFPVTFTPPPNDPHNISPDALKTGLEGVLVGSPGMARHVLPMLLDKLSSEVSAAKEASLKALVAAVRAFGAPGMGMHLRAIGVAMFEEAVHGADPELASLALVSLMEVVRETASYAEFTGLGEACSEWRVLAKPLLEGAVGEVAGDQPCSVLGRGSAKVLQALAASSALGLRSALAMAVPRLLTARKKAAAVAVAEREAVFLAVSLADGAAGEAGGGGNGMGGGGGGGEGGGGGSGGGGGRAGRRARGKVDFFGSRGGVPLEPFVAPLLAELTAALSELDGSFAPEEGALVSAAMIPVRHTSPALTAAVCVAAKGLSDMITRPPVALVGEDDVKGVVGKMVSVLVQPEAWDGGGIQGGGGGVGAGVGGGTGGGEGGAEEGTVAYAVLAALRSIGLRRQKNALIVIQTAIPPLLELLLPSVNTQLTGGSSGSGEFGGDSQLKLETAGLERALSSLVELSDIPGVFKKAVSAMLAATGSDESTGIDMVTGNDTISGNGKAVFLPGRASELALTALDVTLKRGVKRGHDAEILAFIRGDFPHAAAPAVMSVQEPVPVTSSGAMPAPMPVQDEAPPSPPPPPEAAATATGATEAKGSVGPWGLPLLLAALDASTRSSSSSSSSSPSLLPSPPPPSTSSSQSPALPLPSASSSTATAAASGDPVGDGVEARGVSQNLLGSVVSAVRTCTMAAPAADQDALLSSLLSDLIPPPLPATTTTSPNSNAGSIGSGSGGGGGSSGSVSGGGGSSRNGIDNVRGSGGGNVGGDGGIGSGGGGSGVRGGGRGGVVGERGLLPALAAVMGAVSSDSRALGPGGAAAAAVPALLAAALAEGAIGLSSGGGGVDSGDGGGSGGGGSGGGGGGSGGATVAPCCQCLAAVLNKLAPGKELDSAVALVLDALKRTFSSTPGSEERGGPRRSDAMDVEAAMVEGGGGGGGGDGVGPVQCLAWTVKAVAMRGRLGKESSELVEILCGLLVSPAAGAAGGAGAGAGGYIARALAASAAFGIVLGEGGEALTTDAEGGGGGGRGGGGARVSPLWRQRFFVQTFPKLVAAARGGKAGTAGARGSTAVSPEVATIREENASESMDDSFHKFSAQLGNSNHNGGGSPGGMEGITEREASDRVPALLALLHLARGVPREALTQELEAVVVALVQALGSEYPPLQAAALETLQVLLRDFLAEFGQHLSSVIPLLLSLAEGRGGSRIGSNDGRRRDKPMPYDKGGVSAVDRFRAVQCLMGLTALPYSRLHPFKTQVTRRLRTPLDDTRRAVRQAAAEARNVWFLLG
eukprot:jgi/Undpi1/3232/HiC_scaffold_15.g06606.m1